MKDILAFLIGFALCAFTFWLFGFDFDKRGPDLGFSFIMSIGSGAFSLTSYQLHKAS
jgi:hypothetical protein